MSARWTRLQNSVQGCSYQAPSHRCGNWQVDGLELQVAHYFREAKVVASKPYDVLY